jgi:hypothetical protein
VPDVGFVRAIVYDAQVLTSDPADITAYAATLDHADIVIEQV